MTGLSRLRRLRPALDEEPAATPAETDACSDGPPLTRAAKRRLVVVEGGRESGSAPAAAVQSSVPRQPQSPAFAQRGRRRRRPVLDSDSGDDGADDSGPQETALIRRQSRRVQLPELQPQLRQQQGGLGDECFAAPTTESAERPIADSDAESLAGGDNTSPQVAPIARQRRRLQPQQSRRSRRLQRNTIADDGSAQSMEAGVGEPLADSGTESVEVRPRRRGRTAGAADGEAPHTCLADSGAESLPPQEKGAVRRGRAEDFAGLGDSDAESSEVDALGVGLGPPGRRPAPTASRDFGSDDDPEVSTWLQDLESRRPDGQPLRNAFSQEPCGQADIRGGGRLGEHRIFDTSGRVKIQLLLGAYSQLRCTPEAHHEVASRQIAWLVRRSVELGLVDDGELKRGRLNLRRKASRYREEEAEIHESEATTVLVPDCDLNFLLKGHGKKKRAQENAGDSDELFSEGDDEFERAARRKKAIMDLRARNRERWLNIRSRSSAEVDLQKVYTTLTAPTLSFDWEAPEPEDMHKMPDEGELEVEVPEEDQRPGSRRRFFHQAVQRSMSLRWAQELEPKDMKAAALKTPEPACAKSSGAPSPASASTCEPGSTEASGDSAMDREEEFLGGCSSSENESEAHVPARCRRRVAVLDSDGEDALGLDRATGNASSLAPSGVLEAAWPPTTAGADEGGGLDGASMNASPFAPNGVLEAASLPATAGADESGGLDGASMNASSLAPNSVPQVSSLPAAADTDESGGIVGFIDGGDQTSSVALATAASVADAGGCSMPVGGVDQAGACNESVSGDALAHHLAATAPEASACSESVSGDALAHPLAATAPEAGACTESVSGDALARPRSKLADGVGQAPSQSVAVAASIAEISGDSGNVSTDGVGLTPAPMAEAAKATACGSGNGGQGCLRGRGGGCGGVAPAEQRQRQTRLSELFVRQAGNAPNRGADVLQSGNTASAVRADLCHSGSEAVEASAATASAVAEVEPEVSAAGPLEQLPHHHGLSRLRRCRSVGGSLGDSADAQTVLQPLAEEGEEEEEEAEGEEEEDDEQEVEQGTQEAGEEFDAVEEEDVPTNDDCGAASGSENSFCVEDNRRPRKDLHAWTAEASQYKRKLRFEVEDVLCENDASKRLLRLGTATMSADERLRLEKVVNFTVTPGALAAASCAASPQAVAAAPAVPNASKSAGGLKRQLLGSRDEEEDTRMLYSLGGRSSASGKGHFLAGRRVHA